MKHFRIIIYTIFLATFVYGVFKIITMLQADHDYDLTVAIVSMCVAYLALYLSLKTFYSIDEVDAISRMDGNVMENPRYRPNILKTVFQFTQRDFAETSKAILSYMNKLFNGRRIRSGAHLADSVQEVADLMMLIPFFIRTNNRAESLICQRKVNRIIRKMNNKVKNFKNVSDGSCKLLEETVNLIESVFSYQKMTSGFKSDPSKLLSIRGSMFINPVSIILYNNYLGLYYLHLSFNVLSGGKNEKSLRKNLEFVTNCSPENKALALMYTKKATEVFKIAKDNIVEDTVWRGFVCFNLSRALYQLHLLGEENEQWEEVINESISNWITSNLIITNIFKSNQKLRRSMRSLPLDVKTWFLIHFISPIHKISLYYKDLKMAIKEKNNTSQEKQETTDNIKWLQKILKTLKVRINRLKNTIKAITDKNVWSNASRKPYKYKLSLIRNSLNKKAQNKPDTWLRQSLKSQENKVQLAKIIFQMYEGNPLTDQNGNVWVKKYSDITQTDFYRNIPQNDPLDRTNILIKDIQEML